MNGPGIYISRRGHINMKITTELLRDTALYVRDYYAAHVNDQYSFHNYNRTVNIVRNCDALGVTMNLGGQELKLAHLAAWFTELGFSEDHRNYQGKSVKLAREYFRTKKLDDGVFEKLEECILSTRVPQQPVSVISQLICDATMYHLAEKDSLQLAESLRNEFAAVAQVEYSDEEWINEYIKMINNHFYFTRTAREIFQKRKEKTLAAFQAKREMVRLVQQESPGEFENYIPAKEKKVAEEALKLERGVQTLYRITETRHMDLSNKAHDKASLLISVNSIIMSIVLSVLVTKLEENRYLLIPTAFLVITSAVTIVVSIISTRPRIIGRVQSANEEKNLLFYGDFANLSVNDYKKAMRELYTHPVDLYDSLSRDIYYQGVVLKWKFKYINIAYNIFMYGFISTIIAFILAFIFHVT